MSLTYHCVTPQRVRYDASLGHLLVRGPVVLHDLIHRRLVQQVAFFLAYILVETCIEGT